MGERVRHFSSSAKVQIKFGTDKHRREVGVASEVERRITKKFYILTKIEGKDGNIV